MYRNIHFRSFGFTLVETLVAVSVLVVAVAAPMTLAARSLLSAYYAKDQITAFYLAQEAIETVRNTRDQNLINRLNNGSSIDWMSGIPGTTGQAFIVDARDGSMDLCIGTCIRLNLNKIDGLYGYETGSDWQESRFRRSVRVHQVAGMDQKEVVVSVQMEWHGSFGNRTFTISENLYDWVPQITPAL
jgi:Tfp pilus assembly protein PilV